MEYLLDRLLNLSKEELEECKLAILTNQLLQYNEYDIYSLIGLFIMKYRRIGVLRGYSTNELLPSVKWERTQLNYYLKRATKQNVLICSKTKYFLNIENTLVKRIWDYYFKTIENLTTENLIEVSSILKRNNFLEKQINLLNKFKDNYNKKMQDSKSFLDFTNEIHNIILDSYEPQDDLVRLCSEKLQQLIK